MDVLANQVVPFLFFVGVCAAAYVYATGALSKKRGKSRRNVTVENDDVDDMTFDSRSTKKKKGNKQQQPSQSTRPKKSKKKQRIEVPELFDDENDFDNDNDYTTKSTTITNDEPVAQTSTPVVPTTESVEQQPQATTKGGSKKAKKSTTVNPTPAPVAPAPVAPTPAPDLNPRDAEIEKLKRKIRELEEMQQKTVAAVASPPVAATTTTTTTTKKGKKGQQQQQQASSVDSNPPPSLSNAQKAEQQRLLAQYENAWTTIEAPNRKKNKQTIDMQKLLDAAPLLSTVSDFSVNHDQRILLIGTRGQTVSKLSQLTGCRIEIPPERRVDVNNGVTQEDVQRARYKVLLQGTPQQISHAREIINELFTLGYSPTLYPNIHEIRLRVDKTRIRYVFYERVKIIKAYNVQLDFPEATDKTAPAVDGSGAINDKNAKETDVITIKGEQQQVELAKDTITSIVKDGFSALTHPDWVKQQINYPSQYRFVLLRNKAKILTTLQSLYHCRISIPTSQDKQYITVIGPQQSMVGVQQDIDRLVEKLNQPIDNIYAKGFDSYDFSKNDEW